MKTMNGIFGWAVALILLCSVDSATHGFATFANVGVFNFDTLIRRIDKPQWEIGYRFHSACKAEVREREEELKGLVTTALQAWLQPLREEFPTAVIIKDFRYVLLNDFKKDLPMSDEDKQAWLATDLGVTFRCDGKWRSYAHVGFDRPEVYISDRHLDEKWRALHTITHEIGHAFGMADTYAVRNLIPPVPEAMSVGGLTHTGNTAIVDYVRTCP